MSLLVGIHLVAGQLSWKDAANKVIPAKHAMLELKGEVKDNKDLKARLDQAKSKLGSTGIARTIFVMPAHVKTKDRNNLLTIAKELGFGKCGIISSNAANCINSILKFKINLKEKERMAILTKGKNDQIICHYWQKTGSSIKSYIKPYEAKTEENIKVLKENLQNYVKITLIQASISPKPFENVTKCRVMKVDHNYWSSAALLKAGMNNLKTGRNVYVTDFIEKNFEIRLNDKVLKKFERPCLPFKINIPVNVKNNENAKIEIFEGIDNIKTINSKFEKSNIQFSLDASAVIEISIGPPLNPGTSNVAEAKRNYALIKERIRQRAPRIRPAVSVGSVTDDDGNDFIDRQFDQWGNDTDAESETEEEIPQFQCVVCFASYEIKDGCFTCSYWKEGDSKKSHTVCQECLENHAKTPTYTINTVADGIHCVDAECKNVFILANIRNYLSLQTLDQLLKQLQQCNLRLAFPDKNDLHECVICKQYGWVDKKYSTFICECGVIKCSNCLLLYDNDHKGKTCVDAARAHAIKGNSNLSLDEKLSECVIRKCPNCSYHFQKESGCNFLRCKCGIKMCYLCNALITDTSHFCSCRASVRGTCSRCQKTCRHFEDHAEYDERQRENVRLAHFSEN